MPQTKITSAVLEIYKKDFNKFDKNSNGALEGEELKEMAKFQLGSSATEEKVNALVAEMDKNADGKVVLEEYLERVMGAGYVVFDGEDPCDPPKCGRTYCKMGEVMDTAVKVYDEMKLIPLVCSATEEWAANLSTFFTYAGGATVLETKPLVGLAMNEGKPAAWERIKTAATGAMKAGTGNTLVLLGRDGAADLGGIAKDTGANEEKAFKELFTATKEKDHTKFHPAFEAEIGVGDVRTDFKVVCVTEFLEEDVLDFFQWGQLPLECCHLVVVNES